MASSSLCFPATSAADLRTDTTGLLLSGRRTATQLKAQRSDVRCSLDTNVSDMSIIAPKGLFPPEPEHYRGPKLKVAIIGAGLAGMSTAVELLDQGHEVGAEKNLLVKDHTHTFVNTGGELGELDFPFPVGVLLHGINAFLSTNQLKTYDKARNALALALSSVVRALVHLDGAMKDIRNLDSISFSDSFLYKGGRRMSIQRMWDPVACALGFIDCDNISTRCMLTIFSLFATKTEASLLRMLKGSPDIYLSGPIKKYIIDKGGK